MPAPLARVVSPIGVKALIESNDILKLYNNLTKKTGARELLGTIADRYLAFVHQRHFRGANWPPVKPSTIKARRASNRIKSASTRTLIDTYQLLRTSSKKGRGQERRLDVNQMEVRAGIDRSTVYRDPRHTRLGYKSKSLGRTTTLADLARWHAAKGRAIIVPPDASTTASISADIVDWVRRVHGS